MERCPICGVSVKAENLVRHIDENHPRHPDAAKAKDALRADARYAPPKAAAAGFRIRRSHIALVVGVAVLAAAVYVGAPYLTPSYTRDSCIGSEAFHIHSYLSISILGSYFPIPVDIGIIRNPDGSARCTKPLHTHTASDPGTGQVQIHIEGPFPKDFTLGDFFAVWGETFTPTQILTYVDDGTNVVTMTVGPNPSTEYGNLILQNGQRIAIFYGPTS